ncbi:P-loop NTPase fold protein [Streptomyces sp. SL13]|uniref:P-loop NTPase fold protein n=1 Tax=Streptantibioticus silvisoli TaxID=2705255 RepID=A0AA90HAB3_9ACTN|nr:P-loop NTPase fold protein [Streptantibioticus silvisoli]MDI5973733.1 P-loop NTPase fold protein [Streptantibioticus silvisoli]
MTTSPRQDAQQPIPEGVLPLGEPFTGPGGVVWSVGWARDGDRLLLAAGSTHGRVGLWVVEKDADHAVPLGKPLDFPGGGVLSVGWARDGDRLLLATGSDGGRVGLWQVCRPTVVPRLPGYRSDGLAAGAVDELERDGEARAVAELVTARTASPPLAVGLFGDWGEGKSHFLDLVRQKVEGRSGRPGACRFVRQVRFNAWHYAETGLWASLVAELFSQLAAPPDEDPGAAQRELSALSAELVARRRVPERLAAARERRDVLSKNAKRAAADWADFDRTLRALDGRKKQKLKLPGEFGGLRLRAALQGLRAIVRPGDTVSPAGVLLRLFAPALGWFVLAAVVMAGVVFGLHLLVPQVRHWLLAAGCSAAGRCAAGGGLGASVPQGAEDLEGRVSRRAGCGREGAGPGAERSGGGRCRGRRLGAGDAEPHRRRSVGGFGGGACGCGRLP